MASSATRLLKQPFFRALLSTRLCIVIANQIASVAIGWRIFELTHDPLWLGYAGLAEALPAISFSLFAGHIADNYPRQKLIKNAVTLLGFCLLIRTLIGLNGLDLGTDLQIPILFGTIILDGVARAFYGPAFFGIQAQLVAREDLADAASILSGTWQTAAVIGPALGGLLYGYFGPTPTFALAFALAVGSYISVSFVPKLPMPSVANRLPIIQSIREGLKFVFSSQIILAAITLDLFAVLFGGAVAMLPAFSGQILQTGAVGLGLLRSAPAFGAVLTATLLFSRKRIIWHYGQALMVVVAGFGLCMVVFGLSSNFYLSLAALSLSGALDHVSVVIRSTIAQAFTPDSMRGRVSAVQSIFIISSNEIGEFESGVTASWWGLQRSVIIGGILSISVVGVVGILAPALRKLKEIFPEVSPKD